jgi:hypothetical protein
MPKKKKTLIAEARSWASKNGLKGPPCISRAKIEQLRSLDFMARKAEVIAKVPASFLAQCRSVASRVLGLP